MVEQVDQLDQSVADVMLREPKVLPLDVTAGEVRRFFDDHHVHMALLVEGGSGRRLVATLVRDDVPDDTPDDAPALALGRLDERVVAAATPAAEVRRWLVETGRRRVAVVDAEGHLLGLACLKRHQGGFCSALDVASRAAG